MRQVAIIFMSLVASIAACIVGPRVEVATAAKAQCSLVLTAPNPKVWHVACKLTVTKGEYRVGYAGSLYADRINAKMDDPGRIYVSATLSAEAGKETWSKFTVKRATPDKVFSFEVPVALNGTVKVKKTTTLYLLVNAHDNDYDNDIEHLRYGGTFFAERLG